MARRYWISFDLGLQGDYDALYAWLDKHEAKECGENVATLVSERTRKGNFSAVKEPEEPESLHY